MSIKWASLWCLSWNMESGFWQKFYSLEPKLNNKKIPLSGKLKIISQDPILWVFLKQLLEFYVHIYMYSILTQLVWELFSLDILYDFAFLIGWPPVKTSNHSTIFGFPPIKDGNHSHLYMFLQFYTFWYHFTYIIPINHIAGIYCAPPMLNNISKTSAVENIYDRTLENI